MPGSARTSELLREILFARLWARFLILFTALVGALFGVLGPLFQKGFIDKLTHVKSEFEGHLPSWIDLSDYSPQVLLGLSFFALLLSLGLNALTVFLGSRESILMQGILAQKLYSQTLNLRSDSLKGKSVGELVAIYATDIPGATVLLDQTLPVGASILFPLILAPLTLVFVFETPMWPTLSAIAFIMSLNLAMAFRQSKFFLQFKQLAADRIGLVNEWIQNIRTLRIMGWMNTFEDKIYHSRLIETKNRVAMVTNGQVMNSISSSVMFFLNVAAVSSLVYMADKPITPGTLMALLWIVAVFLTRPFRQMPWIFMFIFDGLTSIRRIASVLDLKNHDPQPRDAEFRKLDPFTADSLTLKLQNLNLSIGATQILLNICLEIKYGELIAVVGEVGCGKSSLLLSLLGETGASFENYQIGAIDAKTLNLDQLRQFFTFVPQEGFIMSASLRENVGFEYDQSNELDGKIIESLDRAQFDLRLERLENGLDTEIGERGVNLSGGQKQRISLARVDYFQAPIVLLDDCLSALDFDTEEKLIRFLIKGKWRGRTRILATHRLTVLDQVDRVIFMKGGEIRATGTYEQLLAQNSEFKTYAASVIHKETTDPHGTIAANPIVDPIAEGQGYGEK